MGPMTSMVIQALTPCGGCRVDAYASRCFCACYGIVCALGVRGASCFTVKICSWLLEGLLAYAVKDTLPRQDEPWHEGRQYTALMYARCLYESVRSCWHCSASSCVRSRILF